MNDIVTKDTKFPTGVSGNPRGRPKGAKNKITLLRQALELELREQSKGSIPKVLTKAIEMALAGDKSMIKLLLELHMSKNVVDETAAQDKFTITIGQMTPQQRENTVVTVNNEEIKDERKTISAADSELPDSDEQQRDTLLGEQSTG
jgi:hypothetical protein